jgi:hypothetical protein
MKTLILALLLAANGAAFANQCGFPPFPPFGTYPVCVCDKYGQNCHWIFVSKN